MTPEEEAYEIALRRIRKAEKTGALELDLSGFNQTTGESTELATLNRLPRELERLTSLQSLDVTGYSQLSGDLSPLARLKSLRSLNLSCWVNLSGDLSPLARLTSLQTLNLSCCTQLSGDLSSLVGLTSLRSLNLAMCGQLSDLSPLAGLTSLQSLDLSWCNGLSDLSPLAGLTSLQTLNLSGCEQLSGDLSSLVGLTSLRSLDLSWSELSDLSPLAGLTSLQSLDLSWCSELSDLSPLAGLTSLQSLDLSPCRHLRGDLTPLASLTSLKSLKLRCEHLRGDLSALARLTSLQSLKLSGCENLRGNLSPLARLTSLQSLDLSGCENLRGNLSPLARLTSLQSLDLAGCWHLRGDLSALASLASLKLLNLAACKHLRGDLSALASLTSLKSLDLSYCEQLRGNLSPLARLTSLQSLILGDCEWISDLSPLARLTSLKSLDLAGCGWISHLSPLARLTKTLDLSGYGQLSDLSPLAGLTSLQSLNLSYCEQLSDLSPLAGLTSLQTLYLCGCLGFRRFAPLESLLPTLKELRLFGCQLDDLPPEVCGEECGQNVLDKVRAHYDDLKFGQRIDAEVKVLFLGNGGVGKTQLCRRLRGLEFDPGVPTTHGVQLGEMTVTLENFPEPVRLNLWDFGGQDIYHGSHAIFLQGQAVLLILWTPDLERACSYEESGVTLRHRPLFYWLDYVRAFAGIKGEVLVIQSKCDTRDIRVLHPAAATDDFPSLWQLAASARTGLGLDVLSAVMNEAVRDCLHRRTPPPIGAGRVAVRDRLRQMLREDQALPLAQRQHCLFTRKEFDNLCANVGGVSDNDALLDFLLLNGVVFYRSGLFGERIILDQNWALEAIYALFDREKTLPMLRGHGRFTRKVLEMLIWAKYTPDQQQIFLDMMEGCGICFRLRKLTQVAPGSDENEEAEWEYLAPELLPKWSDAQEQLLGRLRDDRPDAEAIARYTFLHEGILRGYLSKLGERAKDAPIYWKYGCWFYEQKTRSQVLIESQWDDAANEAGAGDIRFRAWGENAESLIDLVLDPLRKLPVGQAPEIEQSKRIRVHALASSSASVVPRLVQNPLSGDAVSSWHGNADIGDKSDGLKQLQITTRSELPPKNISEIFVSFAWGDDSSDDARKRTEVVYRLCETLRKDGWNILRDSEVLRPGDLISGFMKRIGLADHVIVVLSDKYMRSAYCMTELYSIYQRSVGEKEDFLRRIIPLVLAGARISTPEERVEHAKHWETRYLKLKSNLDYLSVEDFRLYQDMKRWHLDVGNMLSYINDVLVPYGFDEIVKNDFAALRQMLEAAALMETFSHPPKYVSAPLELPWKPGHLRSAYGAICCHRFKPKNQTDDIFLALPRPNPRT